LLRSGVTPAFRQIALPDAFLDAGALPTLHERYAISTEAMTMNIKDWLGKDRAAGVKRAGAGVGR
jgi:transketolase